MNASVDPTTGNLLVGGKPVFPLGLSDPPPVGGKTPRGADAWAEIASAGVNLARNYTVWAQTGIDEQLIAVGAELDTAAQHKLQLWLALAGVDDNLTHQALLDRVVNTFKGHPGLGAWKGSDEPAHARVPASGLVDVYKHVKTLDPHHPLALVEAPRNADGTPLTAAAIRPYAAACDIHGIDIYPVSVPPGTHAGRANKDISVVGDVTTILAQATPQRAQWTTLQIAWSGVLPPHQLVFPTLQQARFMAYDAVIAGARGLFWFGGQIEEAMNAADRARGWNWTYWARVQRPLLDELSDAAHTAALLAPAARFSVHANASDIATSTRESAGFVYVIAVRKSATAHGVVRFTGLPAGVRTGTVLAYPEGNPARPVTANAGAFTDPSPYGAHNARVYRFPR